MQDNVKQARLERAERSLEGLSVGDAFGEQFFDVELTRALMVHQRCPLPPSPWSWTDDAEMAQAIVEVLRSEGELVEDRLAEVFARRHKARPHRGYGAGAHQILDAVEAGEPWAEVAGAVFGGTGSMGNGGAMRSAPLGAYFADAPDAVVVEQARRSGRVTHAHREGQAGAIAVAVAAALAWRMRDALPAREARAAAFLEPVRDLTPEGETRDGIEKALNLPLTYAVETAVAKLGNGRQILSQDTVPIALWCAARHLDDFTAAMWTMVRALGDRDTTCAIVGGIVAMSAPEGVPEAWVVAREPLAPV